jgi:hypothetical protein
MATKRKAGKMYDPIEDVKGGKKINVRLAIRISAEGLKRQVSAELNFPTVQQHIYQVGP